MEKKSNKISNGVNEKNNKISNGVKKELRQSILIFCLLLLFWASGAVVDTALWGHENYRTPDWLIKNLHLFWLVLNQFLLPLLVFLAIKPKLNTLILYLSAAFSGNVLWDLLYSMLTRGKLISDSMERWFALDSLGIVLRIEEPYVIYFHIFRLLASAMLFYWLYRRLKISYEERMINKLSATD